ncbi:tyrosine-type recombinase/integrase [Francisella tularensis]|uniref:tyrosine-type recombinase/integrase n=1 Tax=Francisella tularensis TaxID=263 RepID=UPI0008F4CF95|nr:tyrosine-type recombinase/integrase [Francisella tularensis]APA83281.1 phage integrase [Francisella tularensis subsp. novicida PA10-7858]
MKLSNLKIKNLQKTGKDYRVPDGNNLYVRVNKVGSKSFLFRFSKNGKERILTIGKYPEISLSEARQIAFNIRKDISNGIAPRVKKCDKYKTFSRFADEWIETLKKSGSSKRHIESSISRLNTYVYPHIGNTNIDKIQPLDIVDLLREIEKIGYLEQRDKVKSNLNMIFRYAIASGACLYNPVRDISPALIKHNPKNFAFIDPVKQREEFKQLLLDVFSIPNRVIANAFKLLIYTGLRPSELVNLEWCELFDNQLIIKAERMKMKKEHIVPLSKQALDVIDELKELSTNKTYVFPSGLVHGQPINRNILNQNLVRLRYDGKGKNPKQVAHGFRHIISTGLYNQASKYKWRSEAIERILAHEEQNKVKSTYNKYDYLDERAEILQVWADYLDNLLNSNI